MAEKSPTTHWKFAKVYLKTISCGSCGRTFFWRSAPGSPVSNDLNPARRWVLSREVTVASKLLWLVVEPTPLKNMKGSWEGLSHINYGK